MNKSPYQILHLEDDATYEQIRTRYRHLTMNLHPDKQPQNYDLSKKLFQDIDEAYKQISTPLRRYLYRQFGTQSFKLLEEFAGQFQQYEGKELSPELMKNIKKKVISILYMQTASYQKDKAKLNSKSFFIMSKNLQKNKTSKPSYSSTIDIEIERCTFEYEMTLPSFNGFSNIFSLNHVATNLRGNANSILGLSLLSMRRVYLENMLFICLTVNEEEISGFAQIERRFQNINIKLTPVAFKNLEIMNPRISIDQYFKTFNFSAMTDFNEVGIEFKQNKETKLAKSININLERGSLKVAPRLEYHISQNLKLFFQINLNIDFVSGSHNQLNITPGLNYGYRVRIIEELSLELVSFIGVHNYFQINIRNNGFNISLPIIVNKFNPAYFEALKVSAMLLTFFIMKFIKYTEKNKVKYQERLLKQQISRINEQKSFLRKQLISIELIESDIRDKQIKYNGLVIIKAYLGNENKIKEIAKKLSNIKFGKNQKIINLIKFNTILEDIDRLNLKVGEPNDEVEDITPLVQSAVSGSQLLNYNLANLLVFNPNLIESEIPFIGLMYSERGQLKVLVKKCLQSITIGNLKKNYSKRSLRSIVTSMIDYIF